MKEETLYDKKFYSNFEDTTVTAGKIILPYVLNIFKPTSIIDFGCGEGAWLKIARNIVPEIKVCGIDGDYVERNRLKIDADEFYPSDLTKKIDLGEQFDLAISLEVGEHFDDIYSDTFVDNIIRHSDRVVFSAAIPDTLSEFRC